MSRLTIVLALLLLFAAPTAMAAPGCDPGEIACAEDSTFGPDPDCADQGNEHIGWTTVGVMPTESVGVAAEGMRYCGEQDGTRWGYNGIEAAVFTPIGNGTFSWWSQTREDGSGTEEWCRMSASVIVTAVSPGCVAGPPPDVAWGRLLT